MTSRQASSGRAPLPQNSPTAQHPIPLGDEVNGTRETVAGRRLHLATANTKDSTRWQQASPMTWDGLVRWLDLDHPADHRECGGYVPALLRRSPGRKRREDIVSRSVLALDADQAQPDFLADVARVLPGVAAVVHTTWRNGVEGSRYRLLVPLSRDLDGDQYRRLAEAVRDALGDHWGEDKGCPEPERFSWRPSTQGKYHSDVREGDLLDVDAWLPDDEPEPKDEPPPEPQQGGPLHPYAEKAIAEELARLVECDVLGKQGPPWNPTTFEVACTLVEFANSPWSGYTLDQAEADFLAHAPSDEGCVLPGDKGFGPAEHEAMWADVRKRIGNKGRPRPGGDPADDFDAVSNKRPRFDVSNSAKATEQLRQEVGRQGTPLAGLFLRDGLLVHTPRIGEDGYVPLVDDEHSEDGPAQVRLVNADRLRAWVQAKYTVQKEVQDKNKQPVQVDTTFPAVAANLVVDAVELAPNLRPLRGVTHTPMLRKDGTVLSAEGYDEASARLYLPEPGMAVLPVPDTPTPEQVQEARELVDLMLWDFPFNTDHDRANYLALLFTPLLRAVVPPPYPLGLIHAHQPGSGKGFLAEILRTLHGGALRPLPGSNEEFRKQITSILAVTTAPVVQFDNVHKLESSALDALLTADTWDDRVLGYSANFSGKNDRLWIATGNNVAIGGDLLRRVRWVSIDPNVPNPEQRTDFKIKAHLPDWVRDHRGELLAALLTLLRAWVVAGRPLGPKVGSDSFAKWTRTVQGVLRVAGWPGTVGHADTTPHDSNDEEAQWATFLAAVWDLKAGEPWTAKQMLTWVDADDLPADMNPNSIQSVGMWLKNRKGRWAGGYVLRPAPKDSNKTLQWRVEERQE